MASMRKIEKNKRKDPMLVMVGYGGREDFIECFLGFLAALGVLVLVGPKEEEEDSRWESSFNFFFCGL